MNKYKIMVDTDWKLMLRCVQVEEHDNSKEV
jgi:hypothetical protein